MYPTSQAYKQAVKGHNRNWRLLIEAKLDKSAEGAQPQEQGSSSGEILHLTNQDIIMGSFAYDESSVCSDNLDVGATYANGIEFSLENADGRFSKKVFAYAKLTVTVGLLVGEDTWEDIPLGTFFVSEDGKKLSTIPIKALDRMVLLNKSINAIEILPNATPYDIMLTLENKFGFSMEAETRELVQGLALILPAFHEDITCRDFVGYLAAVFGKSARFNRRGELEFYTLSDTIYETDADTRSSLSRSDFTVRVTGVQVSDAEKETYFTGEDDYVVEVAPNPLLINDDITQTALTNAYNALTAVSYSPYTCSVLGDPSIQCGDRVRHYYNDTIEVPVLDENGEETGETNIEIVKNYAQSIITNVKFKFRGASQLEAKGKSPESSRQKTDTAKKLIEIREKMAQDLNDGLTGIEQTILNQSDLLTSSMGVYRYAKYNEDGTLIGYYFMDDPDPLKAQTVWAYTANGIGVSHSGIDGPYTSSWTSNDSLVARMITADMIRTGILKATDDKLKIDLSNGQFETQTPFGTCTILGNEIILRYQDKDTGKPVSYMRLSADAVPDDTAVNMRVVMASNNNEVSSFIEQKFDYKPQTGEPSVRRPLTISSTEGVVLDKNLTVLDSILYDNIKMQRKYKESGNTGVDFVFSPQPFVPPENLFTSDMNPGFENNASEYDPWRLTSGARSSVSITSDIKHSGSNCLHIGYDDIYMKAPVKTPAKNFYIGCWVRTNLATFYGDIIVTETENTSDSPTTVIGQFDVTDDTWVYKSAMVSNNTEKYIWLYSHTYGDNYWDDFFLCESDGYTKEQLDEYVLSLY